MASWCDTVTIVADINLQIFIDIAKKSYLCNNNTCSVLKEDTYFTNIHKYKNNTALLNNTNANNTND